ncbi:hypothetical protein Gogos_000536 [Gossypium gossypioides]|uniref:Uncharacterized protein n=1 Tax=Gossypium gossypioides TaxID=34282 RepID=A0A7J9CTJ6_GOSGO|nr:hypothetical protein [Gossypium gossypioides]
MLRSHWSIMLLSRCIRRIECCSNLDSDNRFLRHLRCSIKSKKLTYVSARTGLHAMEKG